MLLSNSWLKYLNCFFSKLFAKLPNEELKNWKLSIKRNLLSMPKHTYFSNPSSMTCISRLN